MIVIGRDQLIRLAEEALLHQACLLGDMLVHPDGVGNRQACHQAIAEAYVALETARTIPRGERAMFDLEMKTGAEGGEPVLASGRK